MNHNARGYSESTTLASRPWRQGRKVARNVYAQVGPHPDDSDVIIGQFDSEWLAFAAVEGHNMQVVYSEQFDGGECFSSEGICPQHGVTHIDGDE